MAFTDPDGNNPLGWLIAGAILIGKWYHDGRKANGGEANPIDWDWKNANFSIGVGVAGGSFNAYGGIGWNNNYGVAMGYNANSGINVGYISNGTPVLAPLEDKISKGWNMAEEQIKIAFDVTNEYLSQVDWKEVGYSTLDYTRNAVGIVSDFCDVNNIHNYYVKTGGKIGNAYSLGEIIYNSPNKSYLETAKDAAILGISVYSPEFGLTITYFQATYVKAADYIIDTYNKGNEYLKELVSFKIHPFY